MSAVTVQEVVDFSIKQAQALELRAFLLKRLETAKDPAQWLDATPILDEMVKHYAPS
jgi:hypothetical protein